MQMLATAQLMRGFDRAAMTTAGIPGLLLMENAGRSFVDILERITGTLAGKKTVVVCGKGNNGGDGFVIARHIANRGGEVHVILLGGRRSVRGDAKINLDIVLRMGRIRESGVHVAELPAGRGPKFPPGADIVVDAIFGTGFSGDVAGRELAAITWINGCGAFVSSVDIPSGVDASTGMVGNAAVKANLTVAMGLAKIGHYVGEGCDRSGAVHVGDISLPPRLLRGGGDAVYRVLSEDVARMLPSRPRTAHKYSAGKVLVVAGSRAFIGAPLMTAGAALRSGAGAVVLAFPSSIQPAIARRVTEVIMAPIRESGAGAFGPDSVAGVLERAAWADAVALGPGISRDEETIAFVRELLLKLDKPVVVDADALFALSGEASLLKKKTSPVILTPHTGEFAALAGGTAADAERFRVSAARDAARLFGAVLVLKGAPTVTAAPGGIAYVNSTGNPGMATIGSGDVLTGLIAGFAGQGIPAPLAACAGVFVHGLAGDLAAERFGRRSMLATDIAACIPSALSGISLPGNSPSNRAR